MIDASQLLEALNAYRIRLKEQGHPAKAAAVEHCINIVKRLSQ